jgi:predicted TIM-barrel fold metal-dependent hydrolase
MKSVAPRRMIALALIVLIGFAPTANSLAAEGTILDEIRAIKSIDNHAHPNRALASATDRDNEEDALDLYPMPPTPLTPRVRSDNPELPAVWRALWGYPYDDASLPHLAELASLKRSVAGAHGDQFPTWMLDQVGTDTMLANRVAMGTGVAPPRFRWVAFDDALIFPLSNARAKAKNQDFDAYYRSEEILQRRYLKDSGVDKIPASLDDYLTRVVVPTLERQRRAGAVAVKFEAAYLRTLDFAPAPIDTARRVYQRYAAGGEPSDADYKIVQDFIFRRIAREAGRLGLVVHIHVAVGVGSYFNIAGTNPLLLESVFDDPELRAVNFVMIHGGWPYTHEAGAMLIKPNVYADFSFQTYLTYPRELSGVLRSWLEYAPEKVLYGSDAFAFSPEVGWEEAAWLANDTTRRALAMAVEGMIADNEVTHDRAIALAKMVMRENAMRLYKLDAEPRP